MDDIKAVETASASETSFSIDMGEGAAVNQTDTTSTEFEMLDQATSSDEADQRDQEGSEGAEGESLNDEDALPDLGDFDPENAADWEDRYFPEGQMDKDRLSAEFFANSERGEPGLNPATYDFLASKGISKGVAKEVEAALMTQQDATRNQTKQADMALMEAAGGADALKAALEWGKGGGYSQAEREAFNKATSSADPAVRRQAVESLMFRHNRATGARSRPQVPARDATRGQPSTAKAPAAKAFANREEYREAMRRAGDNHAAQREIARRLAISSF